MQSSARAGECHGKILGFAVSGGKTEADVHPSFPAFQITRMLQVLPRRLFRVATHDHNRVLGHLDTSTFPEVLVDTSIFPSLLVTGPTTVLPSLSATCSGCSDLMS